MNIRNLILLLLLSIPLHSHAQENMGFKVNGGAKIGFQAITYNNPNFGIDGYEFNKNTIQSNKIGYTVSPFMRLTLKRVYVQFETTFGITRHSFDFKSIDEDTNTLLSNQTEYNLKTLCLQVPILIGYNIIQEGKYVMSLFTGPKTKFVFTSHDEQEFKHFKYDQMEEILKKRCYYWDFGLGVKIGNVFFDFTYDLGITKVSEYIISKSDNLKFTSNRRDNILSFSMGMIF
ncbi:MAG: PorT family protein [Bacteroidaceae bacterium]|nr:PorT family protein [Bacteroidaceae bacterium]